VSADNRAIAHQPKEIDMKVQTHLRAGKHGADDQPGDQRRGKGADDPVGHR
jgi:hypothetical protein